MRTNIKIITLVITLLIGFLPISSVYCAQQRSHKQTTAKSKNKKSNGKTAKYSTKNISKGNNKTQQNKGRTNNKSKLNDNNRTDEKVSEQEKQEQAAKVAKVVENTRNRIRAEIRQEVEQQIEDSLRKVISEEYEKKISDLSKATVPEEKERKKEVSGAENRENNDTKISENELGDGDSMYNNDTTFATNTSFAQNSILHENILEIGGGWSKINDMYLSPLTYSGFNIMLSNEWWQKLRKNDNFGHVGKIEIRGGRVLNGAHVSGKNYNSNAIANIGLEGGWGFYSSLHQNHFDFKIGPYIGAMLDAKYIYNSYNKPVSADIAADLSMMLSIGTFFAGRQTSYRLRYLAYINLIGADFYPDYWQSYYELEKQWSKSIHFSYIGRRIALRQEITFDMQFAHSTWRLGVKHDYLNYGSNDIRFRHEYISIVVGTIFNYKIDGKVRLK